LHRAQTRPIQSADRSTATVGGRRPEFLVGLGSKHIQDGLGPKRKDDRGECRKRWRRSMAADQSAREKAEPTQLRNEAPLNCVSLRSELDDEVTCGAVKGQDERPFRAPLTAPQGRPSCQSSLLSDPNAKFSVEMWRKPQRTRKVKKPRDGGKVDLTSHTQPKRRSNKGGPPRRP